MMNAKRLLLLIIINRGEKSNKYINILLLEMLKNNNNLHIRIMHIKTKHVNIVNRFNHDLMSTLWTAVIEYEVVLIKRTAVETR